MMSHNLSHNSHSSIAMIDQQSYEMTRSTTSLKIVMGNKCDHNNLMERCPKIVANA